MTKKPSTEPFEFPAFYAQPPFFTLQPVQNTRVKQIKLWCDLIISYFQFYGLQELNLDAIDTVPLFHNKEIQRKLNRIAVETFVSELIAQKRAEWVDKKTKTRCLIFSKSPSEWADIIYAWVDETGHRGSVLTVFELLEGETGEGTAFFGLHPEVFKKAIHELEKRGKATLFQGNSGDMGIKFL